jgi:hypothetical protein
MNAAIRHAIALSTLLATAASAQAAYVCDAPPTRIDQRACDAAKESPEALRSFIGRLKAQHSLNFYDYVDEARQLAWDERERTLAAAETAKKHAAAKPAR